MPLRHILAFAASSSMAVSPALAADLAAFDQAGARRTGAAAGAYFEVPVGGPRAGRARAGFRLSATHDYRDPRAPRAPVVRGDALDLRLAGDSRPTLYVAGRPVTGEEGRRANLLGPASTVVTVAILAAAVVGGIVILDALDDDDDGQ